MKLPAYVRKMDGLLVLATVFLACFGVLELIGMAHNNAAFALYRNKQILFSLIYLIEIQLFYYWYYFRLLQ